MSNIIEQLEAGKKLQEEEGIDTDSLRTKINSSEEISEEKMEKPKRGRKKKTEESVEELKDPFEQAEQIMKESTNSKEDKKEEKPEQYPGFDFNDYYEKGQKIFYIRLIEKLGIKELLELKIRTIYPKMIIACEEKSCTQCIGPYAKDLIFTDRQTAVEVYDSIDVKTYKDVNIKEELGNIEIENTED